MSSIQNLHDNPLTDTGRNDTLPSPVHSMPVDDQASAPLVLLLASGAGLAVASLYYSQPMLGILATDMGASTQDIGLVPTLTQLGYALGILLLAPLGDRHDRRQIILIKAILLVASLLACPLRPHWPLQHGVAKWLAP